MSPNSTLREKLSYFYRVSHIFSLTLDVDEVLRRVMDEVVAATGAERGFLLLRDAHGHLTVHAARAKDGSDIGAPEANFSTSVVNRVIADAQPLLTIDARDDPWLREHQSTLTLSLRSILCVPLIFRDETLGAIYVDNRLHRGAFTADHLELLGALSQHSAIAIENARLFRDMHDRLAALRVLHDLSADMTSTLDLPRVLTSCLERVQSLLGSEAASILILDKDELVFQVALGTKAAEIQPFRIPLTQGIAGWVARNALGTFSNDAYNDERFYGNIDRRSGFVTHMVMAAPLIVKDRVIGVVEVFNKPGGFDDSDLNLLSTIGASAAIAIENARLYAVAVEKGRLEQELRVARDVQANLIPRSTPSVPGWDFAGHWHSALEVSGDFYDFPVDELGRPGIVIADVADKGMAAALFMALTRSIVRASVGHGRSPAESIAQANRLICADAADGMFVTLCYAQIDPLTGEFCCVNAGHPAPLLYRASAGGSASPSARASARGSGEAAAAEGIDSRTAAGTAGSRVPAGALVELTRHGIPLGIDDTLAYECESASLASGDVVVFYTDGVTDALNSAGEDFGKERLLRVVRESCRDSSRDVCDAVQEALTAFIGDAAPADDATFVVVRRQ
jgi:sigma-B regulation protein RsbU (phosphoserine phosphatase)